MRTVASLLLALSFIFGSAVPSLAVGGLTGNLSGTIVDAQTRAPIANVDVTAVSPSTRQSSKTDGRGVFSFVGLQVDTYTVAVAAPGYEATTITGVTVTGDQTTSLDVITVSKRLTTIGRVTGRSRSSAFQPTQTVDQVTISGDRVNQAVGKAASTNQQGLILSAPGATLTAGGNISIRGGLSTEIGYQLDGVNFTNPFLNGNANNGRVNGLGSLQVISGSGDASQGNSGGGVVNTVVKRGARPAFGFIDLEATAPYYNHQFAFEYGWATPNGRLSMYSAFNGQRLNPAIGPASSDAASLNQFYGASYQTNDDLVNNLVYKFGRDNRQSLQFLYNGITLNQFANRGGVTSAVNYYPYDPLSYQFYAPSFDFAGIGNTAALPASAFPGYTGALPTALQTYQNRIFLFPNIPTDPTVRPSGPEQSVYNNTNYLKFEYNNTLSSSMFAALRYYNVQSVNGSSNTYSRINNANPTFARLLGGQRTGVSGELTKIFSDKNTLTLGGKFEFVRSDQLRPGVTGLIDAMTAGNATGTNNIYVNDWINPVNPNAPISAANPCPIPVLDGNGNVVPTAGGDPNGCKLYRTGLFPGGVPRIPANQYNSLPDYHTEYGYFVRDQFSATPRLKFDIGLRIDGESLKFDSYRYSPDPNNPADLPPSLYGSNFLKPNILQPRASVALQLSNSDSVRFGYGRSVTFLSTQLLGTPAYLDLPAQLRSLPATDSIANPLCGSGLASAAIDPTTKAPYKFYTPPGYGGPGYYRKCQSYADQLYWQFDQLEDAPDIGGGNPPTYNNFEFSLQHQFKNGFALRLTPYFKRGYNVAVSNIIRPLPIDPSTGLPQGYIFGPSPNGVNKTSGLEFLATTPDKPVGFSGFLSMTYTNTLQNVVPGSLNEETVPAFTPASIAFPTLYRAGYLSPFVARSGLTYRTKGGFRINPILSYDKGYPIGAGNLTPAFIGPTAYVIKSTNIGVATPPILTGGSPFATNYVDPANPGSYFAPNIAASRGTPESNTSGGALSPAHLFADLDLEYSVNRNTFGLLMSNLFNNPYQVVPSYNTRYQPVATGVSGPLTGQTSSGFPGSATYNAGARNYPIYGFGRSAYYNLPTGSPLTYRFYYQLAL